MRSMPSKAGASSAIARRLCGYWRALRARRLRACGDFRAWGRPIKCVEPRPKGALPSVAAQRPHTECLCKLGGILGNMLRDRVVAHEIFPELAALGDDEIDRSGDR